MISLCYYIEVVSRAAPLSLFNECNYLLTIHCGWYTSLIFTKMSSITPDLSIDVSDDASDIRQLSIVLEILQDNLTFHSQHSDPLCCLSGCDLIELSCGYFRAISVCYRVCTAWSTHMQIPGSIDYK